MDPQLHIRVLWRYRFVGALGLLVAILLALLAYVNVSFEDGKLRLSYRQQETWASHAMLFVTQSGFPWGRSVPEIETLPVETGTTGDESVPRFADPSRFSTLAVVYARLASSDAVRDIVLRSGPIDGDIEAVAITARDTGFVPLIDLAGTADTPEGSVSLTRRAIAGLVDYVRDQQDLNAIASEERVIVTVVERPGKPEVVQGKKLTKPTIVFLGVGMLAVGLIYLLESLRPRTTHLPRAAHTGVSAPPA